MPRSLCLLVANCQGEALRPLLEATPAFSRRFHVRHVVNYQGQGIPAEELAACRLLLYQRLGDAWGEISGQSLLRRKPPQCEAVEIPTLVFKGYWPFLTTRNGIDFADALLEDLLARGLSTEQAMYVYLRADERITGDVAAVAASSLAREREKEAGSPIGCASLLEERWRREQLFMTVNHPGKALVLHVADALLRHIGLGRLPGSVGRDYVHPHGDLWLPIHPVVGGRLGLPFAGPRRRYAMYGNCLTHRDYVSCYLACRRHGVGEVLTLLRDLSPALVATA
jgi:hypothetical protein